MKLSERLFKDFIYNGFTMVWDYQCWEVIQLQTTLFPPVLYLPSSVLYYSIICYDTMQRKVFNFWLHLTNTTAILKRFNFVDT